MSTKFECKDLTSYGFAIDAANTLDEARKIFIDMCNDFDFKSKKAAYIQAAKTFTKPKNSFTQWAWNIILSSEGLKTIKV